MKLSQAILADDLTGSCDVGAECLRAGRRVKVLMASVPGWEKELGRGGGEIPVVDLESRRLSPAGARRRAGHAGAVLAARGMQVIYFKMDSTLRGNWAEESDALRRVLKAPMAWIVPANPGQGRRTLGGRQLVNGLPIETTEYASDPLQPVKCGSVLEIVRRKYGRNRCAWLSLSEIEKGPAAVGVLLSGWTAEGARWVVPDARTDADLERIAELIPRGHLVFGAASLARFVVKRRAGPPARAGGSSRADLSGRWLAVIGSLNPLTRKQVALAGGRAGVKVVTVKAPDLLSSLVPPAAPDAKWLILALDRVSALAHLGRTGTTREAGERYARMFARFASVSARDGGFDGWLFSGGLTAACMCEELGIKSLNLHREIMPGLVISEAEMKGRKIRIITKPGGFGASDALLRLAARGGR